MQKTFSTQSQTLRHITQSQGDQIRPFLQLSRQKITHMKSNTFKTTKILARDWDDGGKRKEDEHPALHDVGGSFRRSFNSSELSWRPYGNSSNNFKSFKSPVQQQKRSYKSQCVHTTTVAVGVRSSWRNKPCLSGSSRRFHIVHSHISFPLFPKIVNMNNTSLVQHNLKRFSHIFTI